MLVGGQSRSYQSVNHHQNLLKLTSHSILRYLWSAALSKSFSQLIAPIFSFLNIFFNSFCQYLSILNIFSIDFARWESMGLPQIAYIVIH